MAQPYVILRADWLTKQVGNEHRKDEIIRHFQIALNFFRDNGLLRPNYGTQVVDENFELRSDDITDDGLNLMKSGYQKWLRKVDKGMDPSDTSILIKELAKVREA